MFKNYYDVRDWLESSIPLVYGKEELGLSRIENLLNKLGNPQKKFKSILVGGTAGKGSTAFYISRLLRIAGPVRTFPPASAHSINKSSVNLKNNVELRVVGSPPSSVTRKYKIGLHISPHLIYIGERMQINGQEIPVRRLVGLVNEIKPVIDAIGVSQPELLPSYFETLVALSFLYFAKEKVDFAVVEVGLGGRLDATNILEPEICVITNVGLDHTELLGNTIEKIAWEKAGIIKNKVSGSRYQVESKHKGGLVVTGATGKALKVIEKVAKNNNSKLINIYTQGLENITNLDAYRSIFKAKDPNSYIPYYVNSECALLALTTVLELKMPLSDETIKKVFSTQFAGRFEEIDSNIIVDGAHNADKIRALIEFVKKYQVSGIKYQVILVAAFKKGKNWQEMIDLLLKNLPIKKVIATEYKSVADTGLGSAVDAGEIADYLTKDKGLRTKVRMIKNSQEAVFSALSSNKLTSDQLVLVTGSLYLVGEARTLWKLPEF